MIKNLLRWHNRGINRVFVGWMLVLAGSLLVRVVFIYGDNPIHHVFTDEGWKLMDARARVLFGSWRTEPHFPCYLYLHPIYTLLHTLNFKLWGVGYAPARLMNAVCGLLTVWLVMRLTARYGGQRAGILAGILAGFNYYLFMIQRSAVIESMAILWIVLAVYVYFAWYPNSGAKLLAGMITTIAVATKLYTAFLLPALMIPLIVSRQWKKIVWLIAGFSIGAALLLTGWLLFADMHTLRQVFAMNRGIGTLELIRMPAMMQESSLMDRAFKVLESVGRRFIYISHLFYMAPAIFLMATAFGRRSISCKIDPEQREFNVLLWAWWTCGLFLLANARFTSIHHLLILVPPMTIAAALWLGADATNTRHSTHWFSRLIQVLLVWFAVQQLLYFALMYLLEIHCLAQIPAGEFDYRFQVWRFIFESVRQWNWSQWQTLPRVNAFEVTRHIATWTTAFMAIIVMMVYHSVGFRIKCHFSQMGAVLIMMFVVVQSSRMVFWCAQRQTSQYTVSKQLGEMLAPESRIIGGEFLGLENKLYFFHHHETPDISWSKATHLIVEVYNPLQGGKSEFVKFPNDRLMFVTSFCVCHHHYVLYSLQH